MSSPSWALTGNAGTNPATDFIGTSDNQALVVKTNGAERASIGANGNIELTGNLGIGTSSPRSVLEVEASAPGALGPVLTLTNSLNGSITSEGGSAVAIDLNTYPPPPSSTITVPVSSGPPPQEPGQAKGGTTVGTPGVQETSKTVTTTYNPAARIEAITNNGQQFATDIVFLSNKPGAQDNGLIERMRLTSAGVGIGTSSPAFPLHVVASNQTAALIEANGANSNTSVSVTSAGVGIGTASPLAAFHVVSSAVSNQNFPLALIEANSATATSPRLGLVDTSQGSNTTAPVWLIDNDQDNFRIFRQPNASTAGVPFLTINNAGLVSVAGDIVLTGADCAEHFDVTGLILPEPGTVLVIDKEGSLRESCEAYDKKVAGVVSGAGEYRAGILLDGRPSDATRVPLALTGKVYCKVDARYSPVEVGDLLTTSPTPGHAMKASEAAKAFGAVIGKALRALDGGQGLLPILVSLQ